MAIVTEFPEPTKILVAGDWHGFGDWGQKMIHYARKQGADVIVHVGDFGFWRPCLDTDKYLRHLERALVECSEILGTQMFIIWVKGNHEWHPGIQEWNDATNGLPWSDDRYPHIIHAPQCHRWQWWGKTWLALGGAHSMDRLRRTPEVDWWGGETITYGEALRVIVDGQADVMVCHDCPDGVNIPGIHAVEKLDPSQSLWPISELHASDEHRKLLAAVVDEVRPSLLVHGHYHVRYSAIRRGPKGLTQIEGLDMNHSTPELNGLILQR